LIECDPAYYRPLEVDTLLGNAAKARKQLNWRPKIDLKLLVKEMVAKELKLLDDNKK
jgi:GDPmannose 4,6-dehydratase